MASGFRHPSAAIGDPPEQRGYTGPGVRPYIAEDARIEAFVTVDAGTQQATYVGHRTWLMKHVHVGHDATIFSDCELAPHCSVGGHVSILKGVRVGQGALFKPYVTIGEGARIGMGAVVICDVPAGEVWAGNPARCIESPSREIGPLERRGWDDIQLAVQLNKHPHDCCPVFPGCCSSCIPESITSAEIPMVSYENDPADWGASALRRAESEDERERLRGRNWPR